MRNEDEVGRNRVKQVLSPGTLATHPTSSISIEAAHLALVRRGRCRDERGRTGCREGEERQLKTSTSETRRPALTATLLLHSHPPPSTGGRLAGRPPSLHCNGASHDCAAVDGDLMHDGRMCYCF